MTVSQIENSMSSREFSEWMIYYSIEPFGEQRSDFRSSMLAAVIANVNGNKTKPTDFIKPFTPPRKKVQVAPGEFSPQQKAQIEIFKAIARARDGNNKLQSTRP